MLYAFFLLLAIAYNLRKFRREREAFLTSLREAKSPVQREMILGHHFHIFIFEAFLSLIVAHLLTEKAMVIGILGFGAAYIALVFLGFFIYQIFVRHIERETGLLLLESFRKNLVQEIRVNFSMILLPIILYSVINWAFQDSAMETGGSLWLLRIILNIVLVSVLTLLCTVILMLKLIPNRELTEPEYVEVIKRRLHQIGMKEMRVRWIETDIKNAFVVGLKLVRFSNQTLFIGKSLREILTLEEFDAVIAHELSHVANRHVHRRLISLLKNLLSVIFGASVLVLLIFGLSYVLWSDDAHLHSSQITFLCVGTSIAWMIFNYSLLFDTIRSHEYEADGYAVMVLGASLEAFKSALHKLTHVEDLPDYLRSRRKEKGAFSSWLSKNFSTHPSLEQRLNFLEFKIAAGLPFDHYVSPSQKLRLWFGQIFDWRVAIPGAVAFSFFLLWGTLSYQEGKSNIAFVSYSSREKILENRLLLKEINGRPLLLGQTLMAYVVARKDPELIDYFLRNGADKGKTLLYISQLREPELLRQYHTKLESALSEEEYYLVLRKTAQMNFTEGYRYLVNSKRFENLEPSHKEDLSQIHKKDRRPASLR
jgi:heat shock protein HtpX